MDFNAALLCVVWFLPAEVLQHNGSASLPPDFVGKALDMGLLSVNDDEKLSVRGFNGCASAWPVVYPSSRLPTLTQMLNFDDIPFDTKVPGAKGGKDAVTAPEGAADLRCHFGAGDVKAEGYPVRSRLESSDFHSDMLAMHGSMSSNGVHPSLGTMYQAAASAKGHSSASTVLSTPHLLAAANDPFLLGDDFTMGFLGEKVEDGSGPLRPRSNSMRSSFAAPPPWSSSTPQSLLPSSAATKALALGLSQNIPASARQVADASHGGGTLSPFIASLHPSSLGHAGFGHASLGAASPATMSPFLGGTSPFYTPAFGDAGLHDMPAGQGYHHGRGGSRSLLSAGRHRAGSTASFEPMAAFRSGSIAGGEGSGVSGRRVSMDDAWQHAGDVFQDDDDDVGDGGGDGMGAGGEYAARRGDGGGDDDGDWATEGLALQHGYGKALASLKPAKPPKREQTVKPPTRIMPRNMPPMPPVSVPPPAPVAAPPTLPPQSIDESNASIWAANSEHAHATRSRTAAAHGIAYRSRRRGMDDDEDDDGMTTRQRKAANGWVGAYSPEARRKRILK